MYRLTVEYDAPADPAAFETRYTDEHVPLVQQIPGLGRFTLSHPKGDDGTPYLVAELWWDDEAAFKASGATAEMAATLGTQRTPPISSRRGFTRKSRSRG